MQIILIGSSTRLIRCITWKFSDVLRQSQRVGKHLSGHASCSTASSRWRQENKRDGCSRKLLGSSESWHCAVRDLHLSQTEKKTCFLLLLLFPRILFPHRVLGVHSVGIFLKLHCGLKEACCYSVIIVPHSSPFPFPSVISHSLLNPVTQTVIISCCSVCQMLIVLCSFRCFRYLMQAGSICLCQADQRGWEESQNTWSWKGFPSEPSTLWCCQHHALTNWKVPFHTHSKSFSDETMSFWCRIERLNLKQTFPPNSRYVFCYAWRIFFFTFW